MRHTRVFAGFLFLFAFISGGILMAEEQRVILETNQGNIVIKLFADMAPKAVENFVGLVKKGYYNGIIFHRVIKNFMIQGGDPGGTGMGGESIWGGTFKDELSQDIKFDRPGLLAMANAGPNTNGSQFFIMHADVALPKNYTIFGKVASGLEVVDTIATAPVKASGFGEASKPVNPVVVTSVAIKET